MADLEEPAPVFWSDYSQSSEFEEIERASTKTRQRRKEKRINRTDVIFQELIETPLKSAVRPTANFATSSRYALCEYATVVPVILVAIGSLVYLVGYGYERAFYETASSEWYATLFNGWVLIMCFTTIVIAVKLCQVALNAYCCRKTHR